MPTINVDISASTDVVAAPGAGWRLVIVGWRLTASAALTKVVIRSGAAQPIVATTYAVGAVAGGESVPDGTISLPLPENTPIRVEITGTGSVGGTLSYRRQRVY